jgi:predicted ATPase
MITEIEIKNCISIVNASIILAPFTLLIGANASGKTNFLHIFKPGMVPNIEKHINYKDLEQRITFVNDAEITYSIPDDVRKSEKLEELSDVKVFSLDPSRVGLQEGITSNPTVQEDGRGVVQVLDALKTGDREDLFRRIEQSISQYIPEIEKLSFVLGQNQKSLQVREKGLNEPIPVSKLSEGTKFVIAFLTIIYQENPPTIICIEEIDRGLHPRLFEKIVQVCYNIAHQEHMPQIIATTHNPYIVDHFKDNENAVILVEKDNGETSFTSLAEKITHLNIEEEDPLGHLWFSGFVGGVPQRGVEH